jgi:hypothetical protein
VHVFVALTSVAEPCGFNGLQGPNSSLNLNVKILVIGLRGAGKTQLIRSLLAMGSSSSSDNSSTSSSSSVTSLPLDAFTGGTKRVEVSQGQVLGVTLTLIDTPGLTASAAGAAANAAVLRKLRKAFQQHEPDLVLYVDRCEAGCCLKLLQQQYCCVHVKLCVMCFSCLLHCLAELSALSRHKLHTCIAPGASNSKQHFFVGFTSFTTFDQG